MNKMLQNLANKAAAGNWSKDIMCPDFVGARKVHDWRNHVPEEIAEQWDVLGEDARAVAYIMAHEAADGEEWD